MFHRMLALILVLYSSSATAETLNILVVSILGEEIGRQEWQPTIDYLNREIPEHHFNLIPIPPIELNTMKEMIKKDEINFVISQPAIYVDFELSFGASRILTMVKKGGLSQFGSTIITRADSPYYNFSDLKNTKIAGVSALGFGGWLVGYNEMLERGFDPQKDATVVYLGTQPKEIQAVLDGEVAAAVIRTGVLEKFAKQGNLNIDNFRVLSEKQYENFPHKISTALYPEWAFAKTKHTPDDIAKRVGYALLDLETDSFEAKKARYQEWRFPYDYQPVHNLLKTLKVGPYKDYGKVTISAFVQQHPLETMIFSVLIVVIISLCIILLVLNIKLHREKREKEDTLKQMAYLATHDSLTDLSNRFLFLEELEKMVWRAERQEKMISVFFIDLDGFKQINDNLGHATGDAVLCAVAKILQSSVRRSDLTGRLGGDEFVIALENIATMSDIERIGDNIINQISAIELSSDFTVGASIGVILKEPQYHCTGEELIQISDQLMYKAKKAGKGQVFKEHLSEKKCKSLTS